MIIFMYVTGCQTETVGGLDMVFILDASGSIGASNFGLMKRSVISIVSSLRIGPDNTRVAVIVFESTVRLEFNLNTYTNLNSLIQAIQGIVFTDGGTNTHLALRLLREATLSELLGVRPSSETTKVAIVITDGDSNRPTLTAEEAENVHSETDFIVFAVGVGAGVGAAELRAIASSDDFVIQVSGFTAQEFQSLEADIQMETCTGMCIHTFYVLCINIAIATCNWCYNNNNYY